MTEIIELGVDTGGSDAAIGELVTTVDTLTGKLKELVTATKGSSKEGRALDRTFTGLSDALGNLVPHMAEVSGYTQKFDKDGKVLQQTTSGLDSRLNKLTSTVKQLKDGTLLMTSGFKNATSELQTLDKQAKQLERTFSRQAFRDITAGAKRNVTAGNERAAVNFKPALREALLGDNDPSKASTGELKSFDGIINKLTNRVARGTSPTTISDLFTKFKAGAKDFTFQEQKIIDLFIEGTTAAKNFGSAAANAINAAANAARRASSRTALKEIQENIKKDLVASNERSATNFRPLLRNELLGGNDISRASQGEAKTFNNALNALTKRVATGTSPTVISDLFTRFKAGAKDFTFQEQKIIDLFVEGTTAANNFGNSAANAVNRAARAAQRDFAANQAAAKSLLRQKNAAIGEANVPAGQDLINKAFGSQLSSASPKQVLAFNSALQSSFRLLGQNKVSTDQFNQAIQNVKSGNIQGNLVGPLAQVQRGIFNANNALTTLGANPGPNRLAAAFNNIAGIFKGLVIYRAFSLITQGITESVHASAEYARRIGLVQTISQDAGVTFDHWYASIRRVSDAFGTDAIQGATAAYDLLSNQVTRGAETTNILSQALAFGRTTNSSATDSVNLFSSAINSFDLKASDADRVARTFFTTIDKGRITASELANSFGRSGTLAHSVGVSLEELQAGISTLTRQGIKGNEAYTLLNNLFIKLLKPTKELQTFLDKIGYSTGQAAIEALGFTGVLEALDKEFDGDTAKIARFFNQMRGGRAAINLTGEGLKQFKADLDSIRNSTGEFNAAKGIVENNFGQKFQDELVRVKNFFTVDVGEKIAQSIVNVKDKVGGFVPILKAIAEGFKLATFGAIGFIGAVALGSVIAAALNYAQVIVAITNAYTAARAAVIAFNAATLFGVGGIVVAGAAIGAAIGVAILGYYDLGTAAENAYDEIIAASEDVGDKITAAETAAGEKRNKALFEGLEAGRKAFLQYAADVKVTIEDLAESIGEKQKEIGEGVKDSIGRLTGILDDTVHATEHKAKEAHDNITKSQESLKALPSKTHEDLFDNNIRRAEKFGNSAEQIRLINQELEVLRKREAEAAQAGDTEAVNKAYEKRLALFVKLAGITNKIPIFADKRVKVGHRDADFSQTDAKGKPLQVPVFGNRRVKVGTQQSSAVDAGTLNQATLSAAQEHAKNLKTAEGSAERIRDAATDEALTQEAIVQKIKDKQKELAKFSVLDKKNKIKEEFKGPEGAQKAVTDVTKIQAEIIKGLDEARKQVGISSASKKSFDKEIAKLTAQFAQQNEALKEQLDAQGKLEALATAQKEIAEGAKAAAAGAKDFEASIAKASGDAQKLKENIRALGQLLRGTDNNIGFLEKFNLKGQDDVHLNQLIREFNEKAPKAITPKDFDSLDKILDQIFKKIEAIDKARAGLNPGGTSLFDRVLKPGNPDDPNPDNQADKTVGRTITGAKQKIGALRANFAEQNQLEVKLDQIKEDARRLNDELAKSKGIVIDIPRKVEEAVDGGLSKVETMAVQVTAALGKVAKGIETVDRLSKELPKNIPKSTTRGVGPSVGSSEEGSVEENARGGLVGHFASGGFLEDFFGGKFASGTDTVPTMLSRGEFVTNAQQTRQFLPLLKAINSGKLSASQPVQHSTTNVGDINVTVKGGSSSEATVQEIAQGLRRGLRRGTIKL